MFIILIEQMEMIMKCLFLNYRAKAVEHLQGQHETYLQHMMEALKIFVYLCVAAGAVFIHAFFPGVLTSTASDIMKQLLKSICDRGAKTQ